MDEKKNIHYVNEQGVQLKDYMIAVMGEKAYRMWCFGNAIKYICRAGKKEGEPTEKDLLKMEDYLEEVNESHIRQKGDSVIKLLIPTDEVKLALDEVREEFETWNGEEYIEPIHFD